jgi:hypothetical protein
MSATALSRPANPDRSHVEIRVMVPKEVVAVIDAEAMDEGTDRTKVLNEWLREKASRELRRANLIVNASRGNPSLLDEAP